MLSCRADQLDHGHEMQVTYIQIDWLWYSSNPELIIPRKQIISLTVNAKAKEINSKAIVTNFINFKV